MPLILKDRVKETTTVVGTGSATLLGAATGFQSFSVIGNGNTTYYTITNGTDWEVGVGTYTASGTVLSRDTVYESSNGGAKVVWTAGVKDVFVTYPAERAVYTTEAGAVGATTVGTNVITLTNPSAITFPRFNADNTVSALDAATFRTAIGAGTGTVTSVAMSGGTSGLTFSGGPITSSGTFTAGGTLATANGGTNLTSYTTGDFVYASATNTLSKLGIGTSGYALLSNGTIPAWGQVGLTTGVTGTLPVANGGTGNSSWTIGSLISFSGTTTASAITPGTPNYVLTTGGTGTIPSWTQVSLTAAVTGTLPVANGGTSFASYTTGDLLVANGTTSLAKLADVATGNVLISGGVGVAPSYGKVGLTTHVSGTLPIANGGTGQTTKAAAFNALSPITTTGDLILGNGTNSNTRLPIGTNGYVLTSNGTTASWQAAGGGGGGVTSFSAGSTGFSPSSATTGAITLSGTLNTGNGGTGTSTTASNGQLLIGNGGGYSVANLTAGSGVTITNGSGTITIAASGGGGPTINTLNVTTSSSGTFYNNTPSSTYSKPLIGSAAGGTNYGAFFFKNGSTGYNVSYDSLSSIQITDTTSTMTSYTSGTDFSSSPSTFAVSDDTVACYGLTIYNSAMQTLFADSQSAQTTPNLAPFDASSGYSSSNPAIDVYTTGSSYFNSGGRLGAVVSKSGSDYILSFGSGDFSSASPTVTSIQFTINSSSSTYFAGSDFTVSFANNSSNGGFEMLMSVSNGTLQTLLNNSFL